MVGQILYLVPSSNFARGRKDMIYNVRIESIGRKYGTITCDEFIFTADVTNKFSLSEMENANGNYSPQYYLFTDFNDIKNKPELRTEVSSMLYGLTYGELKIIRQTLQNIKNNRL